MDLTVPPTNDVPALKKIEKKIAQEGKAEDKTVKANVKELTHAEKASQKAAKAVEKSEHALEKTHRREYSASKDLNKAAHKHDLTVAAIANAEKEVQVKKAEAERLQAEIAKKKDSVNHVLEDQREHNATRENKLAQVHHVRAGSITSNSSTNIANTSGALPVSQSGAAEGVTQSDQAGLAAVGAGTSGAPVMNA
ncbi:hypothetical protein BDP27DRAFT_1328061 [Rhodocollybia butyracea]|uniref:Uncharacterized protein n=1 Tax=Rhodocollybia butyracea TaxID=206335 RepID=A0A9P5U5N1_9AGAR|nr:hypothetical protein BDP27DRAFT_1328061 [Rhodocollybia butyracea]